MRRGWLLLVALAAGPALLHGCSWFRSEPPPLFPIDLCLHADESAQTFRGKSHSLYVRAYPLSLVDAFSATDASALLTDPAPQLAGEAGTPQSRMLRPGASETMTFNAKEDQAYEFIGVVAGYYDLKGSGKQIVKTAELRQGSCYTIEFGPSGIAGGAPAPTPKEED